MEQSHRSIERLKPQLPEQHRRKRVGEVTARDAFAHKTAQDILGYASGGGINGRQSGRERRAFRHDATPRVNHLGAEEACPDLAEAAHAPTGRKLLHLTRIEVEEAHEQQSAFVLNAGNELASRTVGDLGRENLSFHQHGAILRRVRDRMDPRLVFVANRKMQQCILETTDAEPVELAPECRRNTGEDVLFRFRFWRYRLFAEVALRARVSLPRRKP